MKKIYRWIADHLTKLLGTVGASFMSIVAFIDPAVVREAAQTYLGEHAVAKIGIVLFVLVILRGWYTGYKAKQKEEALATAQAALPPVQIIPVVKPAPVQSSGGG